MQVHRCRGKQALSVPDLVEGLVLVPVVPTSPPPEQQLPHCCNLVALPRIMATLHAVRGRCACSERRMCTAATADCEVL